MIMASRALFVSVVCMFVLEKLIKTCGGFWSELIIEVNHIILSSMLTQSLNLEVYYLVFSSIFEDRGWYFQQ